MDRGDEEIRAFLERVLALRADAPPGVVLILQIAALPPDPPPPPPSPVRPDPADIEARALALLLAHRDWSAARIARELGTSRTTLYRSENFRAAMRVRSANRESARGSRKGSRDEVE